MVLQEKRVTSDDRGIWLNLDFSVSSSLEKATRAFTGTVEFLDQFGLPMHTIRVDVEKPIAPGEAYNWIGRVPYTSSHPGLASVHRTRLDRMSARFTLQVVVYADGSREVFPPGW
ncbi:MAG: hypothetical protein RH859_12600 [Longimicrobiales bacterium]